MKQFYPQHQPGVAARRQFLAALAPVFAGAVALVSCSSPGSKTQSFHMGERVAAGKIIYVALETEWKTSIGDGPTARLPQHKFLIVRVSVTNGGGTQIALPLLSLYDAEGKQYRELDDVEALPSWMGALRMLAPVETRVGLLAFDVPAANYKLQITDGADVEKEYLAYIDIPLQLEANPALAEPSVIPKK